MIGVAVGKRIRRSEELLMQLNSQSEGINKREREREKRGEIKFCLGDARAWRERKKERSGP